MKCPHWATSDYDEGGSCSCKGQLPAPTQHEGKLDRSIAELVDRLLSDGMADHGCIPSPQKFYAILMQYKNAALSNREQIALEGIQSIIQRIDDNMLTVSEIRSCLNELKSRAGKEGT